MIFFEYVKDGKKGEKCIKREIEDEAYAEIEKNFSHYKKEYINNYYEINVDVSKLSPAKIKLLQKILNKRY